MLSSLKGSNLSNWTQKTLDSLVKQAKQLPRTCIELYKEARDSRYVQSLKEVNWNEYQLKPILIASILINIIELSSPLYINIVYTSILPSGSMSSLIVLTTFVAALMILGGWLKSVRLTLTGADGARVEHQRRLEGVSHFVQLRLTDFLRLAPGQHLQRLTSINLLRDESALQSLTTAIDLAFSMLCLLYTSPSPRDLSTSRMPSSA